MGMLNEYSSIMIYEAADSLGLTLEALKNGVRGSGLKEIPVVDDLTLDVSQRVVSSASYADGQMYLVRFIGNLAAALVVYKGDKNKRATIHLLNIAKLPQLEELLERMKPNTLEHALKLVSSGVVKSFHKDRKYVWHRT